MINSPREQEGVIPVGRRAARLAKALLVLPHAKVGEICVDVVGGVKILQRKREKREREKEDTISIKLIKCNHLDRDNRQRRCAPQDDCVVIDIVN